MSIFGKKKAYKKYIYKDSSHEYYQIYVGKCRVAEYVTDVWVDFLVDGYNLLLAKHQKEVLSKRQAKQSIDLHTKLPTKEVNHDV